MIREATEADTPRLVEMTTRFLESTPYGALFKADPVQIAKLVRLVLYHGVILVTETASKVCVGDDVRCEWELSDGCRRCQSGQLVGMIALTALPHVLSGQMYADEQVWWVEPEFRSGLVGPRLLMAAETWARAKGCQSVKMVAPAGSTVANYYHRLGYQEVESAFVKILA